jgi:hypothetical protein
LIGSVPFSPALVVPSGENTAFALNYPLPFPMNTANPLGNATFNTSLIGMLLYAGINSPAGVNTNIIYYEAIKADYLTTT